MSLFDVIRYPISYIPTEAELRALPEDLLKLWMLNSDWSFLILEEEFYTDDPVKQMSAWYETAGRREDGMSPEDIGYLQDLRNRIKEYEPI